MIGSRSILLAGLFWAVLSSPVFGCDVNLLNYVTGESPGDAFLLVVNELGSRTHNLGQSLQKKDEAPERLNALMKCWVRFDNQYSQSPPEWAKSDIQWPGRFENGAKILAAIGTFLESKDWVRFHDQVLAFARLVVSFCEAMPMPDEKRQLLRISHDLSFSYEAYESQDPKSFLVAVGSLSADLDSLAKLIPPARAEFLLETRFRAQRLLKGVGPGTATLTTELRDGLDTIQDAFKSFNAKVRGQGSK